MKTRDDFRKPLWFRVWAVLMGIFLSIGLMEIGTRVYYRFIYESPPSYPSEEPPEDINSFGMRDTEHKPEKPHGVYRIIGLGDSFTYGGGVPFEHIYLKYLESLLRSHFQDYTIEVINISRSGATTYEEEHMLKNVGMLFQPDCVIVGYCLNDTEYKVDVNDLKKRREPLFKKKYRENLHTWPWSLCLMRFISERIENTRINKAYVRYYEDLYDENYVGWQLAKRSLSRITAYCNREHIQLLLVIFPLFSHDFDENYPYVTIHKKVRALAVSQNIDVLDLFSTYKGMKIKDLALVPYSDPHPNEKAHMLAAGAIFEKLIRDDYILNIGGNQTEYTDSLETSAGS